MAAGVPTDVDVPGKRRRARVVSAPEHRAEWARLADEADARLRTSPEQSSTNR